MNMTTKWTDNWMTLSDMVEDIKTVTLENDHRYKARKVHDCSNCSKKGTIKPGEFYYRTRCIVDGEPMTIKKCRDCVYEENLALEPDWDNVREMLREDEGN